jgi:pSer/pThr/pTyr-binding forkhead associated (FHA) protein
LRVFLKTVSGKHAGTRIPITGERFLIGRELDCHLRAHSDQVSRHHCAIAIEPDGVVVLDLGSRHGTFVDGERVGRRCELRDGARLRIGPMEFVVAILDEAPEPSDDTQPGSGSEPAPVSVADQGASVAREAESSTSQTAATAGTTIEQRATAGVLHRGPLAGSHFVTNRVGDSPLRPEDVVLQVVSGRNAGLKIPLRRHRFLIGRAKDCHLAAHSAEVSSRHCEILVQPNGVLLLDLGSRNGTFLDGEQITGPRVLHDGARLRVGSLELLLEIRQHAWRHMVDTVMRSSSEATVPEVAAPPSASSSPAPSSPALSSSAVAVAPVSPTADASAAPSDADADSELETVSNVETGEFDLVGFLSASAHEPAKPPAIDILAEVREAAKELAPPNPRDKSPSTKETKEAAVEGLKRMFTPRND